MLGRLGRHPLHPVTSARECTHTAKESAARGLDDGALVAADAISSGPAPHRPARPQVARRLIATYDA
jgi:hypothetical protein